MTGEHSDEPLEPVDPLDERLSAALDGSDGSEPEAPIDPRGAERARELTAARDLLAVPPEPLDELARRKLVRAAMSATSEEASGPASEFASRARDRRRLRSAGIAAAVIAVVGLGSWAAASLNHNSNSSATRAAAGARAGGTLGSPLVLHEVDLHEVSNPLVLKRRVEAALHAASAGTAPQVPEAGPAAGGVTSTTVPAAGVGTTATTGASDIAGQESRCLATVQTPAGATPQILGPATFHGAPAFVIVARNGSGTTVIVLDESDCRLLTSQFLKE
jgi:hypothetical protein